jgi:malate synthase
MEDAATAEICRSQLWQWIHHRTTLIPADAGARIRCTPDLLVRLTDEEMGRVRAEIGPARFDAGRFGDARALFVTLCTQPRFEEFLTVPAYALLSD